MNLIEQIAEYLIDRIEKANINSPRGNTGCIVLAFYPDYKLKLPTMVYLASEKIQLKFSRDANGDIAGMAKLTSVSVAIGEALSAYMGGEPLAKDKAIRLGDLFVEAFKAKDCVSTFREEGFSDRAITAPYVVTPGPLWGFISDVPTSVKDSILPNTVLHKPESITELNTLGYSAIKRWGSQDEREFPQYIDAPWLRSLNSLNKMKWTINESVYEAMVNDTSYFLHEETELPEAGSMLAVRKAYAALKKKEIPETKHCYASEVDLWNKKKKVLKARSKNYEFQIIKEKASTLKGYGKPFYQLVDTDYRGRYYIREQFLNYQGGDLARGLLQFGEGKPLTPTGVTWLAIHTANSFNESYAVESIPSWCEYNYKALLEREGLESISVDKMNLDDRVRWLENNYDMVLSTAVNGKFIKCEKPIVFFACACEWLAWNSCEEGEEVISYLPIPIDGMCNGIQHSAAMSKDAITGAMVGLTKTDVPCDLYIKVAKELVDNIPDWFTTRNIPMKHIRKGITKRATMVRQYAAGTSRIADNMYEDCYTEGFTSQYNIDMFDCTLLSRSVIQAINTVCPSADTVKTFLQQLSAYELGETGYLHKLTGEAVSKHDRSKLIAAKKVIQRKKLKSNEDILELDRLSQKFNMISSYIAKGNGAKELSWISPSGFPVKYRAYLMKEWKIDSVLKGISSRNRLKHVLAVETTIPDKQGYASGIAPNYIHSQDASHMALVIDKFSGHIAPVHDSFATHACDVEELSGIIKQVFVDMYGTKGQFEHIRDNVLSKSDMGNIKLPTEGTLDVSEVLNSDYFFC